MDFVWQVLDVAALIAIQLKWQISLKSRVSPSVSLRQSVHHLRSAA